MTDELDLVALYLSSATSTPLLDRAGEIELARRIECGMQAQKQLESGDLPDKQAGSDLPEQGEAQLREAIRAGQEARQQLIVSNTRLVVSIAKRYVGRGVEFLDLVQEGNLGLMRAIERFDHTRGHKFSTYATWWIRQAIARAIASQGRTLRLSLHAEEAIARIERARQDLIQATGNEPAAAELARATGLPLEKVEKMQQANRPLLSLDVPAGSSETNTLSDFIQDREAEALDDIAGRALLYKIVNELRRKLPPREAHIIKLYFGFDDVPPHTLQQIGDKLGFTRERARQLLDYALLLLKHPDNTQRLQDHLDDR